MLRDVETSVDEGVEKLVFYKYRHRGGVEEQTIRLQEQKLDQSTSYRETIEEVGTFSIDPPGVEKLLRLR